MIDDYARQSYACQPHNFNELTKAMSNKKTCQRQVLAVAHHNRSGSSSGTASWLRRRREATSSPKAIKRHGIFADDWNRPAAASTVRLNDLIGIPNS